MSARQIRVGDRYMYVGMLVEVTVVDVDGDKIEFRAVHDQDAIDRGWFPTSYGAYEAASTLADFHKMIEAADDGRVHDPVEAERQAYAVEAEWAPVVPDPYFVEYARALTGRAPEPEGEPADIGEDDTPRPFQVGDEVLVDGEPGVIAEMRDEAVRVDSAHALVEMTGFSFPAWDVVALSADRTRPVDGRQIELVRPAPTGRISSQAGLASIRHGVVPMDDASAEDRIVAILTDHYDLRWRQDERMHCKADCGYSVDAESATVDHVRRHQAALILAALGGAS